jgi:phosphoglycolate phosphatase
VPVILMSYGYSEPPAAELAPDALLDHFADLPAAARRLLAAGRAAISRSLPEDA